MAELLADAEPVGGCRPRHQAGDGDPGAGGLAGEQVVATLLGLVEDAAELALEAVDGGGRWRRSAAWGRHSHRPPGGRNRRSRSRGFRVRSTYWNYTNFSS